MFHPGRGGGGGGGGRGVILLSVCGRLKAQLNRLMGGSSVPGIPFSRASEDLEQMLPT